MHRHGKKESDGTNAGITWRTSAAEPATTGAVMDAPAFKNASSSLLQSAAEPDRAESSA